MYRRGVSSISMLELVRVVILRKDNVIKYYFVIFRLTYCVAKLLRFYRYWLSENITAVKLILHNIVFIYYTVYKLQPPNLNVNNSISSPNFETH